MYHACCDLWGFSDYCCCGSAVVGDGIFEGGGAVKRRGRIVYGVLVAWCGYLMNVKDGDWFCN